MDNSELVTLRNLYLDLIKKSLVNWIYLVEEQRYPRTRELNISKALRRNPVELPWKAFGKRLNKKITDTLPLPRRGSESVSSLEKLIKDRSEGRNWSPIAHTMIGFKRLDNLQSCIEDVILKNVPGDFIETGVWRGGSTILMRAVLRAFGVTDRSVWVADSFEGLPSPNAQKYPEDRGDVHELYAPLAVSLEQVQENFRRYGLLDQQVKFLKGWFRDTLPNAPIERLAILRLDGDMYESTIDALTSLYSKVSTGGYVIVDDFGAVPACSKAVHDFRAQNSITDEIKTIDWTGVYWQKSS